MANYLRSKFYYNLIELLNKDFTNSDVNNYLNNLNGNEIVEYSNNLNIINSKAYKYHFDFYINYLNI